MTRQTALVMALSGLAVSARAQEIMIISYSWRETIAGSMTPVPSPNSVLEPGEGARIGLRLFATRNGGNAVGQTTTYVPGNGSGTGTIRGIASFEYTLAIDGGAATGSGTWTSRAISPILATVPSVGTISNSGATLNSMEGGQLPLPGQTANSTNPVTDVFRGVWTPASYTARTVNILVVAPATGYNDRVLIQYGTAILPTDPVVEYALYETKRFFTDAAAGINIPIVPSPSGAAVLLGTAFWTCRRREPRPWHRAR